MDNTTVASTAAAVLAVPSYALIAGNGRPILSRWWLPVLPMAAFAGWTTYAVLDGGPLGFWSEHVGTPWETQIWMDLLLMAGVAWFVLQPRLRQRGIRPWPWLVVVLATGSVGMLALLSRLLYAEATDTPSTSAAGGRERPNLAPWSPAAVPRSTPDAASVGWRASSTT